MSETLQGNMCGRTQAGLYYNEGCFKRNNFPSEWKTSEGSYSSHSSQQTLAGHSAARPLTLRFLVNHKPTLKPNEQPHIELQHPALNLLRNRTNTPRGMMSHQDFIM